MRDEMENLPSFFDCICIFGMYFVNLYSYGGW